MAALPLFLLLFVLVVVARVVLSARRGADLGGPLSPELRATARTTGLWRLAGALTGIVAGVVAAYQGGLGRGLMLAAPLFALCVLAGVLIGELRLGTPSGEVRSAALEVRRVRDYVPRRLGVMVAAGAVVLAGVLVWTTALGSADDMGRAGRSLARRCSAITGESRGPWPGSFYTVPLAALVLVGVLAAGIALTRVVRRARRSGDVAVDDALRHSAAEAVTAAVGLLVAVPLAGVSGVAASALLGFSCAPATWTVGGVVLLSLVPVALGLAAWCSAALLSPAQVGLRSRRVPVDR